MKNLKIRMLVQVSFKGICGVSIDAERWGGFVSYRQSQVLNEPAHLCDSSTFGEVIHGVWK